MAAATNTAQPSYTQNGVTIEVDDPGDTQSGGGFFVTAEKHATVSAPTGYVITKAEFTASHYNIEILKSNIGTVTYTETTATVNDIYAGTFIVEAYGKNDMVQISSVTVCYEPKSDDVKGVLLNKTAETLGVGSQVKLKARVIQEVADHKDVVWLSDNTDVATVDQTGNVTAVAPGTATITATATNGTNSNTADDKTATCTIMVLTPIAYLDWDADNKAVVEKNGDNACKLYNVIQSTDGDLDLDSGWYIVNSNVTINGLVRIKGDVHLILCDNAKMTVNNTDSKNPDNYQESPFAIEVKENNSLTVYGQSEGDNAGVLNPICSKGNSISLRENSSMTVNSGRVTTKAGIYGVLTLGTLTINGGDVTFHGNSRGILLNKSANSTYNYPSGDLTINGGRTTAYSDTFSGAIYNNGDGEVKFADNMFFTGKDNRDDSLKVLRITAPLDIYYYYYYYWVRIEPVADVAEVSLNKSETTIAVGGKETLSATVSPINSVGTVTWKSSDETVATVDESGVVTAVSEGTATITATATNGTEETDDDKTDTCTVTVEADKNYISSASLSLNGEIGVNLYIKLGNLIGDGAYVMVKGPNDTEAKRVDLNSELYDIDQNAYKVSCPVYAPQMGEKVEFTLYNKNNDQHEIWNSAKTDSYEVYSYSVNDYIETAKINEKASYKLKTLAGKMQNYGAWSRDYLIASKQISSDTAAIATAKDVEDVGVGTFEDCKIIKSDSFVVEGLSVSLSLDSKTALRIYYKGDKIDDITAFCGDESVTLKTGTARDMNYVEIDNIPAHHLRDNYEFTFGDKGTATVSAYSYCYLVLANSTNEKLKSTVKAMYEYSETAKIYFNQ
ncbi:Ig-like domain-containing protein [Ruminococcus sp. FC2018]|uniref:Ig-like domain-containing protein n=1 Tax=Ruminococcus sp. FC2018 TaxID=1410617 RepID=UPI0009E05DE6|nr:Ig-like domain-containing protein [Ruminococcus sp. FC2018]